ncbi:MAG: Hsp70 family protein [Phycisphaerales bacterium]|nr:Hsp70 family protein [Phycisphaerales bacterium]
MRPDLGRFVGIDLGTTYSAIAYLDAHGAPETVPNRDGQLVTPSVVAILPDRKVVVGEQARALAIERPDRVALNFKRDMGERFYHRAVGGKDFSPEALSALVLKRLKEDFEARFGSIDGAVITVPAYFGDSRRKATEDAGRIASLRVVDVINEPTAAALANAFRRYLASGGSAIRFELAAIAATAPSTTLVFDLGGGTFDVTVIRISGEHFNVLATGGEVRLGGVDFDRRLADAVADEFVQTHGVDPRDEPVTIARLVAACERAKIHLSSTSQVAIDVDYMGRQCSVPFSRQRLEELTADLLTRLQMSVELLLADAMLTWDRIDDVLLVGGSSRMPMIAQMLERMSGKHPNMATAPEQIVAHGAAIHAAITQMTASPMTSAADGSRSMTQDGLTDDEPDRPSLLDIFDPPVIEAANKVRMTDVNSHSLGVIVRASRENNRIVNSVVIPANTPLPTSRTKIFGTEAPNQRVVRCRVVEGDTRDPRGCTQIGEVTIRDLPKGLPQGTPVEVSFRYDRSGRIHVQAVEMSSGVRAEADIVRDSGFDQVTIGELTRAVSELAVE